MFWSLSLSFTHFAYVAHTRHTPKHPLSTPMHLMLQSHASAHAQTCISTCTHLHTLLYTHASLVWTPTSTKLWGFSCFLIRNMFGSLVVYLTHISPHVHFPCIGHALLIATSCTHLCYPCHALV